MKRIAKILDIELNEPFKLFNKHFNKTLEELYCLKGNGVYREDKFKKIWVYKNNMLEEIFSGNYEVIKLPYKPKYDQFYYYIDCFGKVACDIWRGTTFDCTLYKVNNCFKTKEEALLNKDKIMKELYTID